jgi:inner membrane protein
MEKEKTENKFVKWLKTSITVRMIIVGILTLVLLIPLAYIKSLISERQYNQESVVREINQKWGEEVLFMGPVLKVPYKTYTKTIKRDSETKEKYTEVTEHFHEAYFLPKSLDVKSDINPEVKKYSIYQSVVYNANLKASGHFEALDFSAENVKPEDVLWDQAKIIIKTSNLKGISNKVKIKLGGQTLAFLPKYSGNKGQYNYQLSMNALETGLVPEKLMPKEGKLNFSFDIEYNGSKQLRMIPIGEETKLNVKSTWADPSFVGTYLPYNPDKINDNGFDAQWKVLNINRAFPQSFFDELPDLSEFAFGVELKLLADQYQQSTRSAKYGYLVIALTFLVFFLFQTISKVEIHPFQYLMIGIALTMFYILLISISEHTNFSVAYLISSASVVALITLYSKSILKTLKFTAFIAGSLIALYVFIYVIIQMENYALITGSIGLFVILAMVMFASKKIDWNKQINIHERD